MNSIFHSAWIASKEKLNTVMYTKDFTLKGPVKKAFLNITSIGVYKAELNGRRVGKFILAPGFTSYKKRLQYQEYDISDMLKEENRLRVFVGEGWCGRLQGDLKFFDTTALLCTIDIEYENGEVEWFKSDDTYKAYESGFKFTSIYDGEEYDASFEPREVPLVLIKGIIKDMLIPQEGEEVREQEIFTPKEFIITPKGEKVIDFGQNMAGYIEFALNAKKGDIVEISHAEVLDKDGNFYTENLRSAKQKIVYTCKDGEQSYKPSLTYFGFRYIRIDQFPGDIKPENFKAIVVHSQMKRTGYFECSNPKLNKLFNNILFGMKSNYLDIPTDCPQRDERLGWTADTQVFARTACYLYDVEKFFRKWLGDLRADQMGFGGVPATVPATMDVLCSDSAGWGDCAVIVPWCMYLAYGDKEMLLNQFVSMKKWVDFIHGEGEKEFLWDTNQWHFGDWCSLDFIGDQYNCFGGTDKILIASAFFAYSTAIVIKAGKVLGLDMSKYEALYENIKKAYRDEFLPGGAFVRNECLPVDRFKFDTQTAHVLTLYFDLAGEHREKLAARLAQLVRENGNKLNTGFLGTPYLLHVLSENGYKDLAYDLMLREEFPSWLYSVNRGATTIWEHWDGINEEGDMWSPGMNSFNHYAYGVVGDWMFGAMAGINVDEDKPAYEHIILKPITDERLDYVKASVDTRRGTVKSEWERKGNAIVFSFTVPEASTATIILENGERHNVGGGIHIFTIKQ